MSHPASLVLFLLVGTSNRARLERVEVDGTEIVRRDHYDIRLDAGAVARMIAASPSGDAVAIALRRMAPFGGEIAVDAAPYSEPRSVAKTNLGEVTELGWLDGHTISVASGSSSTRLVQMIDWPSLKFADEMNLIYATEVLSPNRPFAAAFAAKRDFHKLGLSPDWLTRPISHVSIAPFIYPASFRGHLCDDLVRAVAIGKAESKAGLWIRSAPGDIWMGDESARKLLDCWSTGNYLGCVCAGIDGKANFSLYDVVARRLILRTRADLCGWAEPQ